LDYFEGLLLGPQWSDTDYANRRHFFSFFFFGVAVCMLALIFIFTGELSFFLIGNLGGKLTALIVLFLATPFISFRYYRLPIFGKIPILLLHALKLLLVISVLSAVVLPMIHFDFAEAQVFLIDFVNKTLEDSVQRFSTDSGSFSTILGVVAGGLYFVFLFLILFLGAVLIPGLSILFFRLLQWGYDKLIAFTVLKNLLEK